MKLSVVGDKIQEGRYRLHSTFNMVKNFASDDNLVSIVKSDIGYGPNYLTSDTLFSKEIKSFVIKDKIMDFDSKIFDLTAFSEYNSNFDNSLLDKDFFISIIKIPKIYKALFSFDSLFFLLSDNYFPKTVFQKNFYKYAYEVTADMSLENLGFVTKKMKGIGLGLTPAGDDFNVGILYALHLISPFYNGDLNNIINVCYKNAVGKNKISNSFLYFAYINSYFSDFKDFLEHILKPDCPFFLKKVLAHGHTSGADMLSGFILTIKSNFDKIKFE